MSLSERQLKFIAKHQHHMSVKNMARALGITPADIENYHPQGNMQSADRTSKPNVPNQQFNHATIKQWLLKNWYILAGLAVTIIIIYANSINNVFISDDLQYLVDNPKLPTLGFFSDYPATIVKAIINWLTYKTFGLTPPPFHVVNIIFHIGASWAFYFIISKLFSKKTAVMAAFIWAVHPILTESVTWVGGGGYIMYTFFFLVSFAAYLVSKNSHKAYIVSLVIFVVMLGTSEKSIPLLVLFPLYELMFGNIRKNWKKFIPYFIFTAIWVTVIFGIFGFANNRIAALQQQYYMAKGYDNPLVQIPVTTTKYLQLIFWPDQLSFYQSNFVYTKLDYVIVNITFISLMIFMIYSFFKIPLIFFWLSVFFISLSPSLTPLRVSWWVAERYVYLGSAAIVVIFCYLISLVSHRKYIRIFIYTLIVIVVICLMTRTIIRNNDWKTADSLWIATGITAPLDPKSHNNLGDMYARHNNFPKAAEEFGLAIKLQNNYADAYHNLAVTQLRMNQTDQAVKNLNKAVSINPGIWESHYLLATTYYQQKQLDKALDQINQTMKLIPNESSVYYVRGLIYRDTGETQKAKSDFTLALKIKPDNTAAKSALDALSR